MLKDWLANASTFSPMLLCIAALVGAAVGAVLPLAPTEPLLLGLAAVAPPNLVLPIAVIGTFGHMCGKVVVYMGSLHAKRVLSPRHQRAVDRARSSMERAPALQSLTLVFSGAVGLPPFYGVTVLSGTLGVPLSRFLFFGSIGRLMRFTAVVMLPGIFS